MTFKNYRIPRIFGKFFSFFKNFYKNYNISNKILVYYFNTFIVNPLLLNKSRIVISKWWWQLDRWTSVCDHSYKQRAFYFLKVGNFESFQICLQAVTSSYKQRSNYALHLFKDTKNLFPPVYRKSTVEIYIYPVF